MLARVSLGMPPAVEPSFAGEVFPWLPIVTPRMIPSIQSIHLLPHEFQYLTWFTLCCAGLFALYIAMLRLARGMRQRWFVALAAAGPVAFMVMLVCTPVMLSSDIYSYAHYGRMLALYGQDVNMPTSEAYNLADPFGLGGGYFFFVPNVYGPLWTVISAIVFKAGAGHIGLTVLLFRLVEVLSALGCGALIWLIIKEVAPDRATEGLVLFLWNPLVIIESAFSGHNDTCMMALALLALWLHLRGYKAGAVVAFALSALVKVITWALIPLYMLMILRAGCSWKSRAAFVARSALGIVAATALSMWLAHTDPHRPARHMFTGPQFYLNNYHEPLFRQLRRMFGEPESTIQAPIDFEASWVAANESEPLHADISDQSRVLYMLRPGQPLLVLSSPLSREPENWVRLFDPADRAVGFMRLPGVHEISAPPDAMRDPTVRVLSVPPKAWPTVIKANWWIRAVTWSLFIPFALLAAWKTTDFERFIYWSTAFFLASELLVFSKIWPWYMVWPLAIGAILPRSVPARLSVAMSAGFILLYVFLDYADTRFEWAYDLRSLFTIVLPVILFALVEICRRLVTKPGKPSPRPVSAPVKWGFPT